MSCSTSTPTRPATSWSAPTATSPTTRETTDEEAAEIADLTREAMRVVRAVSGAGGFNIGMNQGAIAGAGIAAHLHQHVVPRWPGDQNFMPIIGRTKTLPELLTETRALLADAWG